jgi:Ran GTPase-activating protein (RanGAP) involved in mRNA processing and transport
MYYPQTKVSENSTTLNLVNHGLYDDDLDRIIEQIKKKPSITALNLYRNMITPAGAKQLFELSQLKEINFSDNYLGDDGAKLFVNLYNEKKTNVVKINLSGNGLSDEGVKTLLTIKNEKINNIIIEPCGKYVTSECLAKFRGEPLRSKEEIDRLSALEQEINQTHTMYVSKSR